MKRFIVCLALVSALLSCPLAALSQDSFSRQQVDSLLRANGLPPTATLADDTYGASLLMNFDRYDEDMMIYVSTLWLYNKESGKVEKLFTTNIKGYTVINGSGPVEVSKDNICAMHSAKFVGEDKIIVEGVPDMRNIYTYLIDLKTGRTLLLPTTGGCLGTSSEEGFLICQSYAYYEGGGRYTVILVVNNDGRVLKKISLAGLQ